MPCFLWLISCSHPKNMGHLEFPPVVGISEANNQRQLAQQRATRDDGNGASDLAIWRSASN